MTKRSTTERLDDAVEALMKHPDRPHPAVDPRIAELLRVAADLRDLPSQRFKARLEAELLSEARSASSSSSSAGQPLVTADDIGVRLAELAERPKLVAHDLRAALDQLPEMSMRFFAPLNQATLGVSRFAKDSHWERHPAGDELLHILEGEAEVVTFTADGLVHSRVNAGSLFICPQGLWHRVRALTPVSMLFATPGEGTEHSRAKSPPTKRGPVHDRAGRRSRHRPSLVSHDLQAALRDLPELTITASTTAEEADAAVRPLANVDPCLFGVMRYSGLTPWERHPAGDELLHVLDGEVEVTVLTDDGRVDVNVPSGSIFVCPRGLWHRQLPRPSVTILFGTPSETTEVSFAADPRLDV
jgi:quercetin dioxygenase-like cupin family protein